MSEGRRARQNGVLAAPPVLIGGVMRSIDRLRAVRYEVTPAQAIDATLGRGTCRITDNGSWGYPYVCSECSASFDPDVNGGDFNYCPNCGRKVVE